MFESWFPKYWSTLKKLIWLKASTLSASLTTLTGSIVSFIASKAKAITSLVVTLEPQQSGSGEPYPAGGSAQLIPTYTEDASSNQLTLKVNSDGSVTINGTASATTTFDAPASTWEWDGVEDCWLSGCPQGGSSSSGYSLRIDNDDDAYSNYDTGSGVLLANSLGNLENSSVHFRIVIRKDTVCNNLTFRPMLNKGTSAQPFKPYSNFCPITGWTGASVFQNNGNLITSTPITTSGLVPNNQGTFNNSSSYSLYAFPVKKGAGINFWCSSSVEGYLTSTDTASIVSTTPQLTTRVALTQSSYPISRTANGSYIVIAVKSADDLDSICVSYQSDEADYNRGTTTTTSVTFPAVGINIYNSTANPIEQGSITSATGASTSSNDRVRTNGYIHVKPNTTYTVTGDGVYKAYFHYYGEQSTSGGYSNSGSWIILPATITIPNTANYLRIVFATQSDGAINPSQVSNVQLKDHIVYSGTYDFVSGVGVADYAIDTFSKDSGWYSFSTGTGNSSAVVNLSGQAKYITGNASKNGSICSCGVEQPNYWASARQNETIVDFGYAYGSTGVLRVHRSDVANITDLTSFKNALPTSFQICYPLAEPITFTLTPQQISTLVGQNNIWSDAGDVAVTIPSNIIVE